MLFPGFFYFHTLHFWPGAKELKKVIQLNAKTKLILKPFLATFISI